MRNPLLDTEFLKKLDEHRERVTYARVIALTKDEAPLEQIEGRVTQGSINLDGTSAVRRTCSLSMIAKDLDINNYYWGLKNKFKLEIGVENKVDDSYPDIVWFPQGTYVIVGFNTSVQANNYTISISGKDKMCLLNGEVGGNLPSSVDFGKIEEITYDYSIVSAADFESDKLYYTYSEKNNIYETYGKNDYPEEGYLYARSGGPYYTITPYPVKNIIKEAVHAWGGEPLHNIIINDVENYGLELLEYRDDSQDLYLFREVLRLDSDGKPSVGRDVFTNMMLGDLEGYAYENIYNEKGELIKSAGDSILVSEIGVYDNQTDLDTGETIIEPWKLYFIEDSGVAKDVYTVAKKSYGDTVGYRMTDLIYPGDLIANVGEPLTTTLDKIKNMLGEFEYFYDLDGRFIFQKKQTYIDTTWSPLKRNADTFDVEGSGDMYVDVSTNRLGVDYEFHQGNLITAFQNNPQLNNLKNDYSIWGIREGITGAEIPIHLRYAIDKKPIYYKTIDGHVYIASKELYESIKAEQKQEIIDSFMDKVKGYKQQYGTGYGLLAPEQQDDGSWSPGWWDIRDWYEFYQIMNDGEIPRGTMKWYSRNDEEGFQKVTDVVPKGQTVSSYYVDTWLVIVNPLTGRFNFQHGSGAYSPSTTVNCTYHESYLNDEGQVVTVSCPSIQKRFHYPYAGCSNTHTYLSFLKDDIEKQGNLVYFYNPAFPNVDSFKDLVEDQINKEWEDLEKKGLLHFTDWRELIYQMAKDYRRHGYEDYFYTEISKNNLDYYPEGYTGYEQYYTDMEGFWRQLYDPTLPYEYEPTDEIITDDTSLQNVLNSGIELYIERYDYEKQTNISPGDELKLTYYTLNSETGKYELYEEDVYPEKNGPVLYLKLDELHYDKLDSSSNVSYDKEITYYESVCDYDKTTFWHQNIVGTETDKTSHPELLNFWFDFLDTDGELNQFSVPVVGIRTKAVSDNSVTTISAVEVPTVLYINEEDYDRDNLESGYTYIFVQPNMENIFKISAAGKSAVDSVNELLYQHSYCIESVTITAVPIYYLQPNSRIYIRDDSTKIDGEYIISKITIPMAYNGTMSITATKAAESIN